ncbi:MAG: EF-hand domain-containing protein [Pseudomonadota bacterium]|nr:EF-hand domain-containing protein [Pseudomonadota bacterium]
MKKILAASAAGLALIAGTAAIAQNSSATSPLRVLQTEKVQSRTDVQTKISAHFTRLDSNRDGFLTKAEAEAAMAQLHAKRGQRAERRGGGQGNRFERLDANRDGQITRAEADARNAARAARRAQRSAKPSDRGAGMFDRLDANRDGTVTRAEFDAQTAQRQQRIAARGERKGKGMRGHGALAGRMFDMSDANKDGRVSLQEATGAALSHFDMADTNRDGTVTREERRQMRQQMRTSRQQQS